MHSKSILFITPYPHGEAPSQRFRFEQYLRLLQENGFNYSISPFLSIKGWNTIYKDGKTTSKMYYLLVGFVTRFLDLLKIKKYNLIFIHREATPMGPPVFEWIVSKIFKKKIIYDFDDAIWLEDPDETGTLKSIIKWKSKVKRICQWSYKVSVGNKFLADYAIQYCKNTFINPTTIDTNNLHNPKLYNIVELKDKVALGWTGTHSTLQYLASLVPVLEELEKKMEFEFIVISNKPPVFKLKSLKYIPWNKATEIEDLMKIDIGLMPLTEDLWSQGKCGFKALQYMALEKPALVSPVGVNTTIIQDRKNGFICQSNAEWLNTITSLINDNKLRKAIGTEGRKYIIKYYSVSSNSANFLALFSSE